MNNKNFIGLMSMVIVSFLLLGWNSPVNAFPKAVGQPHVYEAEKAVVGGGSLEGRVATDAAEVTPAVIARLERDVISTTLTAEPQGTIYFSHDFDKIKNGLAYSDLATGGTIEVSLEGARGGGIYRIDAAGTNLTKIHPYLAAGGEFAVSPDGQKMLYTVDAGHDIYMSNIDGSNPVNLTNTPNLVEDSPRWLPDGQRFTYLQTYDVLTGWSKDDYSDIYLLDVNQGEPLNLTNHPTGGMVFEWDLSDQQLFFVSEPAAQGIFSIDNYAPKPPYIVSTANLDGSQRLDLIQSPLDQRFDRVSWSPDKQRIALTVSIPQKDGPEQAEVRLVNSNGTQLIKLADIPDSLGPIPAWSPDGQSLAVAALCGKSGYTDSLNRDEMSGIQFFGRDGTAQTACIDLPDAYTPNNLQWSPDGQHVAIMGVRNSIDGQFYPSPQYTLFTIKADGINLIPISDSDMNSSWDFTWSPDGQWLAFFASTWAPLNDNGFTSAEEARTTLEYKPYVGQADGCFYQTKTDCSRIIPLTEEGNFSRWIYGIDWQP